MLLLEGTLTYIKEGLELDRKTWVALTDQLRAEMTKTVMMQRDIPWWMRTWSDGAQKISLRKRS